MPIRQSLNGPGERTSAVGATLSADTLKQFQRAAYIRDAFFQTGGNQPAVALAVLPPVINGAGASAKIEVGGTAIVSPNPQPSAGGMMSPARRLRTVSIADERAVAGVRRCEQQSQSISDTTGQPSILERTGPWSLFRLLEAGSMSVHAETASATFIVAGRELELSNHHGIDQKSSEPDRAS